MVVTDMQSDALMVVLTTVEALDLARIGSDDAYAAENSMLADYVGVQARIAETCGRLNSDFLVSESLRTKD
jgi:hypothetical protein